jgi:ABC-type proline/glycine betaine transport system ATPase subunit
MLGGRIVQRGAAGDIIGRPRCPFVARFLGLDASAIAALPGCAARCDEKPGECIAEEPS